MGFVFIALYSPTCTLPRLSSLSCLLAFTTSPAPSCSRAGTQPFQPLSRRAIHLPGGVEEAGYRIHALLLVGAATGSALG